MRYLLLGLMVLVGCASKPEAAGYRAPDGFVVEEAAAMGPLAALTFDSLGRPTVADAAGSPVILADLNGDGRFETARVFGSGVRDASGMWWDGRTLYVAAKTGLYRCPDANADDEAETCELLAAGETLAVRRGIDGAPLVLGTDGLKRWDAKAGGYGAASRMGRAIAIHPEGDPFPADASGAEFYTSDVYPVNYRGAYFQAHDDGVTISQWKHCGGGWCEAGEKTSFVSGAGRVTGMEAGPDGALWFTNGSGLYRVAYKPGLAQQMFAGTHTTGRQAQPLSSWGHAALLRAKAGMGDGAWKKRLWESSLDRSVEAAERVEALLTLDRTGPRATAELLRPLAQDSSTAVRAAAILVASFHSSPRAKAIVMGGLNDADALVRRRALEGMVRMGLSEETFGSFAPANIVYEGLNDPDGAVRRAAGAALERYPREEWAALALREKSATAGPEAMQMLTRTARTAAELDALFPLELAMMRREALTASQRVEALRAFQLTAARREGGAPEEIKKQAHGIAAALFPAKDERLARELVRVLEYCEPRK